MLLLVLDSVTSAPQCICKPRPRVYLKEGTYHTRLFRGPSTNGMKSRMVLAAPDPLLTPPPSSSICADLLTTGPVSVTPCAHRFHKECIESWIQTKSRYNKSCNCPLCNQKIPVISSLTPQSQWLQQNSSRQLFSQFSVYIDK